MTPEQPSSRITVEEPVGGRPPGRSHRWLLPLVVLLVAGAIWSFRGEATPENVPPDLASIETTTTTTHPVLEGDLSTGWVSIDLPGSGEVVELTDTRFGVYAAGRDSEGAVFWKSTDGLAWEQVVDEAGVFVQGEINSLIETEYGLVATGAVAGPARFSGWGEELETRVPAVWRSVDGLTWTALSADQIERPIPPLVEPDDDEVSLGAMNDVVVWNDRLVAVGWSGSGFHRGAAWVSGLDGSSWRLATVGLDGRGTQFAEAVAVAVIEDELLTVGSVLSRPTMWISPDSMTWTETDPDVTLGTVRMDYPTAIATDRTGSVAVGRHLRIEPYGNRVTGPVFSPIWVSRDGLEWIKLNPEELQDVLFDDVLRADPWLVAAGRSVSDESWASIPGVWFSKTGSEWEKVDLSVEGYEWGESGVNVIIEAGPGLIAGGMVQGLPELWVWSSSGAIDPGRTPAPRPRPGSWAMITDLEPDLPVWNVRVVFGEYVTIGDGGIWRSKDWVNWERESWFETGLAAGVPYGGVVVAGETAYVADESGRLWSSPDGREWSLRVDDRFEGWVGGLHAAPDGGLLLLEYPEWESEDDDESVRLWRLTSSETWIEVALPEVEWVLGVTSIDDRLLVAGWDSFRARVWVSDDENEWVEPDLAGYWEFAMPEYRTGNRLFVAVHDESGARPVARILFSDDGLQWTETGAEFAGWAGQIVDHGGSLALQIHGEGWGSDVVLWSSQDGFDWVELGPVPSYGDSWVHLLPSNDGRIRVVVEGEYTGASIWEWIPPEDD